LEILEENDVEAWYLHALPTKIELILDDVQHSESLETLNRIGFEIQIGDPSAVVSLVGSQIGNWQDGLKQILEKEKQFCGNYKFINSEGPSLHFLTERNTLDKIISHLSLSLGLTQREISN
jgi:aspartokinase